MGFVFFVFYCQAGNKKERKKKQLHNEIAEMDCGVESKVEGSTHYQVWKHFAVYVLYYCWQQGDRSKHHLSLKHVADIVNSDDEYGDQILVNWQQTYAPPSTNLLLTYKLQDVLQWYKRTYELPALVMHTNANFVHITDEDMQKMDTMDLHADVIVFNTTRKRFAYFDREKSIWHLIR